MLDAAHAQPRRLGMFAAASGLKSISDALFRNAAVTPGSGGIHLSSGTRQHDRESTLLIQRADAPCRHRSGRPINRVDLLHVFPALPTAMRALLDEEDVAFGERAFATGTIDEGHTAVEKIHQLEMRVRHRAAMVRRRIPGSADEFAIRRTV